MQLDIHRRPTSPICVPRPTQKIVQVCPRTIHELQIAILSFALESLSDIYTILCDNLRPSQQSVAQINPSSSKHVALRAVFPDSQSPDVDQVFA